MKKFFFIILSIFTLIGCSDDGANKTEYTYKMQLQFSFCGWILFPLENIGSQELPLEQLYPDVNLYPTNLTIPNEEHQQMNNIPVKVKFHFNNNQTYCGGFLGDPWNIEIIELQPLSE